MDTKSHDKFTEIVELSQKFKENFIGGRQHVRELYDDKVIKMLRPLMSPEDLDNTLWRMQEGMFSDRTYDNTDIARRILTLRREIALENSYPDYAAMRYDYLKPILPTVDEVRTFLEKVLKTSYIELKQEIDAIREKYPEYTETDLRSYHRYAEKYRQERWGDVITVSYEQALNAIFGLIKRLYDISFEPIDNSTQDIETWNIVHQGQNYGNLQMDVFAGKNKTVQNASISKSEQGNETDFTLTAYIQDPDRLSISDVRILLGRFRVLCYEVVNEDKTGKRPIEIKQVAGKFLEKFLMDDDFLKDLLSVTVLDPETKAHIKFGTSVEKFVQAMKDLIELEMHVCEIQEYDDLKLFENKVYRHIYDNIIHDEIFPEYLETQLVTISTLLNSFVNGWETLAYVHFVGDVIAEYLFQEYERDHSFIEKVIELWNNPSRGFCSLSVNVLLKE